MDNGSTDRQNELYRERMILRQKGDKILEDAENALKKGRATTDARNQFNNWLKSAEGKAWKKQEFEARNGICAYCGELLREKDAVVHHIEPLSKFGDAANRVENYRLIHPNCNNTIGTKIVKFIC